VKTRDYVKPVVQPLLEEWPELKLVGRWLIYGEVEHYVRGIYFDGPRSKSNASVYKACQPLSLLNPDKLLPFHWLDTRDKEKRIFDLGHQNYAAIFYDAFKRDALPFLQEKKDLSTVVSYIREITEKGMQNNWGNFQYCWCCLVEGKFEEADRLMDELFRIAKSYSHKDFLATPRFQILARCRELIRQGSASAISDYLLSLEVNMVDHLKIRHLWKRTPFFVD
jgi:hypothetical protein